MIRLYSSGAPIRELAQHFPGLLDAWELSNRLSDEVCKEHKRQTCRDWDFSLANLNHYNWSFWLMGLALALEVPDDQWQRLLALVGGEGQDMLFDRVIASRSPERSIGSKLLHAKPYARLLAAVDAPQARQAALLREFVDHWYTELKRPAPKNRKAPTIEPFWYIYGDPEKHPHTLRIQLLRSEFSIKSEPRPRIHCAGSYKYNSKYCRHHLRPSLQPAPGHNAKRHPDGPAH